MGTKYGQAAFEKLAGMKAAFKARRNLLIGLAAIAIVAALLARYVF